MQRILLTAATLAVLVYAMVLGVQWLSPRIENDLSNRVVASLAEANQLWANAEIDGRALTLTGEAPSAEAQAAAREAISNVYGIARLTDLTTLPGQIVSNGLIVDAPAAVPPTRSEQRAKLKAETEYRLVIEKQGETVTLRGAVPDEASRILLVRLASLHFPEAELNTTELVIAEGAPAGWRSAAGSVLFNLASLDDATATLVGREIMVSGTALSAADGARTEESIRNAVPTLYKLGFAIETTEETAEQTSAAEGSDVSATATADTVTAEAATTETVSATVASAAPAKAVTPTAAVVAAVQEAAPAVSPTADAKPAATSLRDTVLGLFGASATKVASATEVVADDAALAVIAPAAGDGCSALKAIETERLHFDFDKAKVRKADFAVAKRVAQTIKGCVGGPVVEVQGHTDMSGSSTYNQWLSEQRAEAGVRALVRNGVLRTQLSAKGYGDSQPVASNNTREGRAQNRRVEFRVGGAE